LRRISPHIIKKAVVTVPGSKSYTHRVFIAAALSDGSCTIKNALKSRDTDLTLAALKRFGIKVKQEPDSLVIFGAKGDLESCNPPIHLEDSGTSMRLLMGLAAIGTGTYTLTGSERLCRRPVAHLIDGLNQIGVPAVSINNDGCPPVRIIGGETRGGRVDLDCSLSSQYLSALLLIAPILDQGLNISITRGPVSKPYIDMTADIMSGFGVQVIRDGYRSFYVPGGQEYKAGVYVVEPDCSQASYFWAAAAITGSEIKVKGVSRSSKQGDVRFVDILASMGCRVVHDTDGISVIGGPLSGVLVNMADMPDLVPTLAVVAAFADGVTRIRNVSHLKVKESDRLSAVINELTKMGISARAEKDDLIITGGTPHGAAIDTYNDHRMAMSFAVAGLRTPGVEIKNEQCVEKSFPGFWEVFDGLYGS